MTAPNPSNKPAPTHYQALSVEPGSTASVIREQYLRLVSAVHSDALGAASNSASEARVRDLNAAYSVLKQQASRSRYDAQLAMLYRPCTRCRGRGLTGSTGNRRCPACQGVGWFLKRG